MRPNHSQDQDRRDLRSSAEDRLKDHLPEGMGAMTDSDYVRLAHELQVHQVELELQNEELCRTAAELELSLNKYADLFDFAPISYFVLDQTGLIREANLAGATLLGTERARLIDKSFARFVADDDRPRFAAFMDAVLSDDTRQVCELSLTASNGVIQIFRVDGIRISAQARDLCRIALTDITELKQKEAEITGFNSVLEQRIFERTATLAASTDALERALLAKTEFLAMVSHELRTPLTGVLAMSESLQALVYGPLNERQMRCAANIETSGRHLLALINDLLDMSAVDAGHVDLHATLFDVEEVCNSSLEMVAGLATNKRQQMWLEVDSPNVKQYNDRRRIQQILVNLLNNAVKFTPEGGEIQLRVWLDGKSQMVTYSVQDTGIGIAAEDIPRIFQPFVQLDAGLTRNYAGTGLGLVLARRMAELCGGQIGVESVPGQGSRFYVSLPQLPLTDS